MQGSNACVRLSHLEAQTRGGKDRVHLIYVDTMTGEKTDKRRSYTASLKAQVMVECHARAVQGRTANDADVPVVTS